MDFIPYHSGSTGNLYKVSSGESALLIEAGVRGKAIKAALGYSLSAIEAALISHSHGDHCLGVKDVLKAGVDCYMSQETAEAIGIAEHHRVKVLEPLKQYKIGVWTILPFETMHDCPGALGFLVSDGTDKLLFATDTFYLKYRFKGLTIIAVECNWSHETISSNAHPARLKRLLSSHFSLDNCRNFFLANDLTKVREVYLLHLSDDNSDAAMFQKEIQSITGKPVYVCDAP